MSRRNLGPKLKFLDKRGLFYIVWTEDGRSRERSTGTADSAAAQIELAQFLQRRASGVKTREPSDVLITDVLTTYLEHLESTGKDCERAAYAAVPLTEFFAGKTIADAPTVCVGFQSWRKVSNGTIRRDLGVLQSAIKYALDAQLISRQVIIKRPPEPPARERWLSRSEAAILIAGALGFQPVAYDIRTRLPLKWKRVTRPQYHLALFILLGLYTGRRKEAILSLRWPKVDLVRDRIDFRRERRAETKKKRGFCTLPARLKPHLVRAKGEGPNIGPVIQWEGAAIETELLPVSWTLS